MKISTKWLYMCVIHFSAFLYHPPQISYTGNDQIQGFRENMGT